MRQLFAAFLAALVCFALAVSAAPSYESGLQAANETSPTPSVSASPSSSAIPANATVSPTANATSSPSVSASPSASATALPSASPSSVANVTASPSPSASPKPKLACGNYTGCGNCTEQWSCVWCDSDSKCEDGGVWGPDENPFNGCADWRWRQCKANGKAIFWSAVCIAAVLVILFLFCCFCCCCYCRRKRRLRHIVSHQKSWSQIKAEEAEMDRLLGTRTPKTDTRREQVYAKYGRPGERNVNNRSSLFAQ